MAHLWPLILQRLVRFFGNSFFITQPFIVFQGTDLTGFAGHNLAARPSLNLAVCPAAACSPPLCANVPHAIASSWPSCGGQVHRRLSASHRTSHHGMLHVQSHVEHSCHCRPLPAAKSRHNGQQQIQGAAMRFAIKFTARPSGLKPSSTSRHSLTFRSSRHLQASLVGSLRAAHSGAAYL